MRVIINGLLLTPFDSGGNLYTYELIRNLAKMFCDLRIMVLLGDRRCSVQMSGCSSIKEIFIRMAGYGPVSRVLAEQIMLPCLLGKSAGADIFHSPFFYAPYRSPWNSTVITAYDIRFLEYPKTYRTFRRTFLKRIVPRSLSRAKRIIAISDYTKKELVCKLAIDPSLITVVPLAVGPEFRPVTNRRYLAEIRRLYRLPEKFILSVGEHEPRKNVARLVKALQIIRSKGHSNVKLVLVGRQSWGSKDINQTIVEGGLTESVIRLGYVPREHLAALYSLADVYAYPSIYEGFGLPALESMACGTPAVVAQNTSLPEVVGDAGILVNPFDEQDIARGLLEIVGNSDKRKELQGKGIVRARSFSWTRVAEETYSIYRDVLRP